MKRYLKKLAFGVACFMLIQCTSIIGIKSTVNAADTSITVEMFNINTAESTSAITPKIRIKNSSSSTQDLSDITLRYYYTIDSEKTEQYWCDWATVGSSNITSKFEKLATTTSNADRYLEIGFTSSAGILASGASTEIQMRFSRSDWSNYTQSNDYSFNPTATNYAASSNVTAYINGVLKAGTEPVKAVDTEKPTVPGNYRITNYTSTSIDLEWSPSTDNVGIRSYIVYRTTDNKAFYTKGTKYTDTALRPGTKYSYIVYAQDTSGNPSASKTTVSCVTHNKFLMIVSSPLYGITTAKNAIDTYKSDLINEGWNPAIIKVNNVEDQTANYKCETPNDLKNVIRDFYDEGYQGFVIIGSAPAIPNAMFVFTPDFGGGKETYEYKLYRGPSDLFYADMGVDWVDTDNDGVYEMFSDLYKDTNGDGIDDTWDRVNENDPLNGVFPTPDMFYGRISAAGIVSNQSSNTLKDEADHIASYLTKIHNYRLSKEKLLPPSALIFYDDDWGTGRDNVNIFKSVASNITAYFNVNSTNRSNFQTEMTKGYRYVTQNIHSDNTYHEIHTRPNGFDGGRSFDSNYNLSLVNTLSAKFNYINLFSCQACRYANISGNGQINTPNFGATYLFTKPYTFNVTGSTVPGGMYPPASFFENIDKGSPIGIEFQNHLNNWIGKYKEPGGPKYVLLGDPTLRYDSGRISNKVPHITTQLYNLETTSGTTFKLTFATSDPENDTVYVDVTGLPTGAKYTSESKTLTWTPTSTQKGVFELTVEAYNKNGLNNTKINNYTERFTIYVK